MLRTSARNVARIAQAALTRDVPVYAHFGITHRCNLTCKMCGIWRYGNEKEELTVDEIRFMAARMRRIGVVQVSIGGGEPFAVGHLEEAAKAFIDELRASNERVQKILADPAIEKTLAGTPSMFRLKSITR